MKAKIGLLGCGNPSRSWYMPTLSELTKYGEIEWVALCDMDEKLAEEHGAKSPEEPKENYKHMNTAVPSEVWQKMKAAGVLDESAPTAD